MYASRFLLPFSKRKSNKPRNQPIFYYIQVISHEHLHTHRPNNTHPPTNFRIVCVEVLLKIQLLLLRGNFFTKHLMGLPLNPVSKRPLRTENKSLPPILIELNYMKKPLYSIPIHYCHTTIGRRIPVQVCGA